MRLIDAKVATNAIGSINTGMPYDDKDDIVEKAIGIIDHLPTVDAVPVVHGHWRQRGGRSRCSNCDGLAGLKDTGGTGGWSHEYEYERSSYCPHCGAKMEGDER